MVNEKSCLLIKNRKKTSILNSEQCTKNRFQNAHVPSKKCYRVVICRSIYHICVFGSQLICMKKKLKYLLLSLINTSINWQKCTGNNVILIFSRQSHLFTVYWAGKIRIQIVESAYRISFCMLGFDFFWIMARSRMQKLWINEVTNICHSRDETFGIHI